MAECLRGLDKIEHVRELPKSLEFYDHETRQYYEIVVRPVPDFIAESA